MKMHGAKQFLAMAALLMVPSIVLAEEAAAPTVAIDPALPIYEQVDNLSGEINLIGSNTMSQIAAIWGDGFQKLYPNVKITTQVKSSAMAIPSVTSGEATFGLLSRQANQEEVRAFYDKYGYLPTILTPSFEPMAVFVHKDNPIKSASLSQLDALFSKSLKRGEKSTVRTWGELGATGQWAGAPVLCQGRSATTGSQVFFQSAILAGGEYRADMASHKSNLDLIKAISSDPRAIGFAGVSYLSPEVKPLAISWKTGEESVDINTAGYPLVRPLQVVVNKNPNKSLTTVEREFLKYILSQPGQRGVVIGGFTPIPARISHISANAAGLRSLE